MLEMFVMILRLRGHAVWTLLHSPNHIIIVAALPSPQHESVSRCSARAPQPAAASMADDGTAGQQPEPQEPTVIATSRPFLRQIDNELSAEDVRAAGERLWSACRRLSLSMNAYTTALLYLQRFLVLTAAGPADIYELATACLVAALKTEGSPKKLESVDQAMQTTSTSRTYELERQILETNAFDFRLAYAHAYVVKISKSLGLAEEAARGAWCVVTDAYETPAVLQYPAHTVALGSICVHSRLRGEKLLIKDSRQLGSRGDAVKDVMRILLKFYADRSEAALKTHASLTMRRQDYLEWISHEKFFTDARQETIPLLNSHEVSVNGVARYRLKAPR